MRPGYSVSEYLQALRATSNTPSASDVALLQRLCALSHIRVAHVEPYARSLSAMLHFASLLHKGELFVRIRGFVRGEEAFFVRFLSFLSAHGRSSGHKGCGTFGGNGG